VCEHQPEATYVDEDVVLFWQRALAEKEALFETQRQILESEVEQVRGRERQATIRLQQALAEVSIIIFVHVCRMPLL
jgi:hypothetical protein